MQGLPVFNPRSDAPNRRDEPGKGDDVPCVKCGGALDTGLECTECGHDNYEAVTGKPFKQPNARDNRLACQPVDGRVGCSTDRVNTLESNDMDLEVAAQLLRDEIEGGASNSDLVQMLGELQAAERYRWAKVFDTMREKTLAAQSGRDSDLANVMLRQLAELGFGECARALRA